MPMRFSHAHKFLPCSWGSARAHELRHTLMKFGMRFCSSVRAHTVQVSGFEFGTRIPDAKC
jgi:hypothetical protein